MSFYSLSYTYSYGNVSFIKYNKQTGGTVFVGGAVDAASGFGYQIMTSSEYQGTLVRERERDNQSVL